MPGLEDDGGLSEKLSGLRLEKPDVSVSKSIEWVRPGDSKFLKVKLEIQSEKRFGVCGLCTPHFQSAKWLVQSYPFVLSHFASGWGLHTHTYTYLYAFIYTHLYLCFFYCMLIVRFHCPPPSW